MDSNMFWEVLTVGLSVVAAALVALAAVFVPRVVRYLEDKFHIEVPERVQSQAVALADRAIGYAHERALRYAKEKGSKMTGSQKLHAATVFFRDHLAGGLEDASTEWIERLVEARLGEGRLAAQAPALPPPTPLPTPKPPVRVLP